MKNRAIFLDRDGVLNEVVIRNGVVSSPWKLAEFILIEEAKDFVKKVKLMGYLAIVVTNQPDIARKNLKLSELKRMNKVLLDKLEIDNIEVCMSEDNNDFRRKPNPGMLLDAAKKYDIILSGSFFIGDSEKDIVAGKLAGVRTILLQKEYNKKFCRTAGNNCFTFDEILEVIQKK